MEVNMKSSPPMYKPTKIERTMTKPVSLIVSLRVGQRIFSSSLLTSLKKIKTVILCGSVKYCTTTDIK